MTAYRLGWRADLARLELLAAKARHPEIRDLAVWRRIVLHAMGRGLTFSEAADRECGRTE